MKSPNFFNESKLWIKSSYALMPVIFLILVSSCQKAGFEEEMFPAATFMNAALEPTSNSILYYGTETFKIVSDEPLVATRTLTNPDFKYFENFVLKVQNGKGNSNKKVTLEILIDDVLIMSSADFTKGKNVVLKELTALTPGSVLEVRMEGPKNKSITLLIECTLREDVITDIDGNYYKTVKIGDQWWMAENLKVTKFNDGTPIPNVTDDAEWKALENDYTPGFCWYNNDPGNKDIYGGLYSRGVAYHGSGKNVCPVGWHIPPDSNGWMIMFSYLNPELEPWWNPNYMDDIGNKLKEAGTSHWNCIGNISTNETGFTALPGGQRPSDYRPGFSGIGEFGIYWADGGLSRYTFFCETGTIFYDEGGSYEGLSVRCVKD
jgi:uncharacterized protein (TIGR02145 family)